MAALKGPEIDRARGRLDPAYRVILLYGPDQGLVSERAEAIARAAVTDPSDPFQMVRLDGGDVAADPLKLADEANTIGLFGGQRAIRVSATTKQLAAAVEPLLAAPPRDAIVVIEAGDLQKSNPLRLMAERSKAAAAVPCYPDESAGLGELIDRLAGEAKLSFARDARAALVARLGADRRLTRGEIEKLLLYCHGQREITVADVEAATGDAAASPLDDVVDGAFAGERERLDRAWARLRQAGGDASVLLGAVLRHALTLLAIQDEIAAAGVKPIEAIERRRLHFRRKPAAENALRRLSREQLARIALMLDQATAQARLNGALADAIAMRALWNIAQARR